MSIINFLKLITLFIPQVDDKRKLTFTDYLMMAD